MGEPVLMKLCMYVMVFKPISTASLCLYVYLPIVARQRLGTNVTAAENTQVNIVKLLDASFSMRYVSYHEKQANISSKNTLLFFLFFTKNAYDVMNTEE
jgi:hypothetical protein